MCDSATVPLPDRLRAALLLARKARDHAATAALRSAIAAIENAEALDAPATPDAGDSLIAGSRAGLGAGEATRRQLSSTDIVGIVRSEIDDLRHSADDYHRLGRDDEAAALRHGAEVLDEVAGEPR